MQLSTDLILDIISAADWREVVRFAGTCREVREKVLNRCWSVPFVATEKNYLALGLYKFNDIEVKIKDRPELCEIGKAIANCTSVRLSTNSFCLMDGISSTLRDTCRRIDGLLEFDIMIDVNDETDQTFSNILRLDMFMGWREVSFGYGGPADKEYYHETVAAITRNAMYAASDCVVMSFRDVEPMAPFLVNEIHIYDSALLCAMAYCRKLYVYNSTVEFEEFIFDHVEEIHIINSECTIRGQISDVFPNAKIYGNIIENLEYGEIEKFYPVDEVEVYGEADYIQGPYPLYFSEAAVDPERGRHEIEWN